MEGYLFLLGVFVSDQLLITLVCFDRLIASFPSIFTLKDFFNFTVSTFGAGIVTHIVHVIIIPAYMTLSSFFLNLQLITSKKLFIREGSCQQIVKGEEVHIVYYYFEQYSH